MNRIAHFPELLQQFVNRSGYSTGQLAKLTGIPKMTLVNWLNGRVQKPRVCRDLLQLAHRLHLSEAETDALLTSTGYPIISQLQQQNPELQPLLNQWPTAPVSRHRPFQAIPDLPYFVGRERVLAEIETLISGTESGLMIGIVGMGGVGKTSLAAHAAYRFREQFPDGVLWARLRQSEPGQILASFALAYGVDLAPYPDLESRSRLVRDILADKRALIVFDDVTSSERLTPLLPPTRRTVVLITCRQHHLAPLRRAHRIELGSFGRDGQESFLLFRHFLGDQRVEEDRQTLLLLAEKVGHLPLAIEIIASRLAYEPGWTTADFLARLTDARQQLTELSYDNQSVHLSFAVSFAALPAAEQQLFVALHLFRQGEFNAAAVSAICQLSPGTAADQLRHLHSLSLIQAAAYQRGGERLSANGRYLIHPLLASYAAGLIPAADEVEMRQRFVHYFLGEWLADGSYARMELEQIHILQAIEWGCELELAAAAAVGYSRFYPFLEAHGLYDTARTHLNLVLPHQPTLSARIAATLCWQGGRLAYRQGEYLQAEQLYEEGLGLARLAGAATLTGSLLRASATLSAQRGDYGLAEAYFREGLLPVQDREQPGLDPGDQNQVIEQLQALGMRAFLAEAYLEAAEFYDAALTIRQATAGAENRAAPESAADSEKAGSSEKIAARQWGKGLIAWAENRTEAAEQLWLDGISQAAHIGHQERLISLWQALGRLSRQQGQLILAETRWLEALRLAARTSYSWQRQRLLAELGELYVGQQDWTAAAKQFQELQELARHTQNREMLGLALYGLARVTAPVSSSDAYRYGHESAVILETIAHQRTPEVKKWLHTQPGPAMPPERPD